MCVKGKIKMKYLKYSLVLLFIAIVLNLSVVNAINTFFININLTRNNVSYTAYKTKSVWQVQSLYYQYASTSLTDPCPNCKIEARIYKNDGTYSEAKIGKMGDIKSFNYLGEPGSYRMKLNRYDITLLTTNFISWWYIDIPAL